MLRTARLNSSEKQQLVKASSGAPSCLPQIYCYVMGKALSTLPHTLITTIVQEPRAAYLAAVGEDDHQAAVQGTVILPGQALQLLGDFLRAFPERTG